MVGRIIWNNWWSSETGTLQGWWRHHTHLGYATRSATRCRSGVKQPIPQLCRKRPPITSTDTQFPNIPPTKQTSHPRVPKYWRCRCKEDCKTNRKMRIDVEEMDEWVRTGITRKGQPETQDQAIYVKRSDNQIIRAQSKQVEIRNRGGPDCRTWWSCSCGEVERR